MESKKLDSKNYKLVKFFLIKSEVIYIILSLDNLNMERNEDLALDLEVF